MEQDFDASVQPADFGLIKLPIPAPPNLEIALGYPGNERYVAFHEYRVTTAGFFLEDADQKWPGVEAGWSLFCRHPAVARVLEALRLDFKRTVPIMAWDEWIALPPSRRDEYWAKTRYLVLDRQERVLYVSTHPSMKLFLTVESAARAPDFDDGEEEDEIPDEELEARLQPTLDEEGSILDKEPKLAAEVPVAIGRTVLEHLRSWLDEHEPLEMDYTPGPAEICGFRTTNIGVQRGQIEDSFGYRGGRRYISLHRSPKLNKVFVCDGIGRWSLSEATRTWDQFLNHALVKPHLQGWDEGENEGRTVLIDFSGQIDELPDSPIFSSVQSARDMEADVKTNCLLYDRAHNQIHTGSWASALLFHSLVEDALEEDLVPDSRPRAAPLLAWLNERQEDPQQIFAVAASHHQHRQEQDALAMLRHCIEREPDSHLYWCWLSQTLGSLNQWEDALGACEKAIEFHASAPRQQLSAGYMLKWKAQCLFMLQRYSEAADTHRFVIEIDNSSHKADSYSQLARCYERLGASREAVDARERQVSERAESLSEALKDREVDHADDGIVDAERFFLGEAWLELGRCHVPAGNIEAAEWAFRRAIEVDAESIRAHAELGALLRRLGRIDDADDQLRYALTLAKRKIERTPQLGSAHSDAAFVYRAMGNYGEAEQADQRAADLGSSSSDEQRRVVSLDAPAVEPR
jgi:tetratricopeptide (TPR) repeat protein